MSKKKIIHEIPISHSPLTPSSHISYKTNMNLQYKNYVHSTTNQVIVLTNICRICQTTVFSYYERYVQMHLLNDLMHVVMSVVHGLVPACKWQ